MPLLKYHQPGDMKKAPPGKAEPCHRGSRSLRVRPVTGRVGAGTSKGASVSGEVAHSAGGGGVSALMPDEGRWVNIGAVRI